MNSEQEKQLEEPQDLKPWASHASGPRLNLKDGNEGPIQEGPEPHPAGPLNESPGPEFGTEGPAGGPSETATPLSESPARSIAPALTRDPAAEVPRSPESAPPPGEMAFPRGVQPSDASIWELSPALFELCSHLGSLFAVSPYCVLVECLLGASAALRNSVRLRLPSSPRPVNAALQCALCEDGTSRLANVFEFVIAPMVEQQNARLADWPESRGRMVEKKLKRLEESYCSERLSEETGPESTIRELEDQLKLVSLVTNAPPGELVRMIEECRGNSLTALYDDLSINQLLESARTRAMADCRLLSAGWNGVTLRCPGSGSGRPSRAILEPAIASVIFCSRRTLGRLLSAGEPPLQPMTEPWVVLMAADGPLHSDPVEVRSGGRALEEWQQLMASLLKMPDSGGPAVICELSSDAEMVFLQWWNQHRASPAPCKRPSLPMLAGKMGLVLQMIVLPGAREISGEVMRHAIRLAEWLAETTHQSMMTFIREQENSVLDREADKMLGKLLAQGRIAKWDFYRKFNDQRKQKLEPILQRLLQTGEVIQHGDGTIEAAELNSPAGPIQ